MAAEPEVRETVIPREAELAADSSILIIYPCDGIITDENGCKVPVSTKEGITKEAR